MLPKKTIGQMRLILNNMYKVAILKVKIIIVDSMKKEILFAL